MRIFLSGGPFGGRIAESNVDETDAAYLVFDQDGNALGITESGAQPVRFLGFRVDVETSLPALGETRTWSATYRRTDRKEHDGTEVWEHVDDPTYEAPLID